MVNAEPPWGGGPKKSLRLPWPCSAYAIFHSSYSPPNSPLLNLVEGLDHGHRHKDHDRLLAALDVNLLGGGEGKLSELSLELGDVGLEVNEGLSDLLLDLRGGSLGSVGGAQDLGVDAGHGLYSVSWAVVDVDWETLTTFLRVKDF